VAPEENPFASLDVGDSTALVTPLAPPRPIPIVPDHERAVAIRAKPKRLAFVVLGVGGLAVTILAIVVLVNLRGAAATTGREFDPGELDEKPALAPPAPKCEGAECATPGAGDPTQAEPTAAEPAEAEATGATGAADVAVEIEEPAELADERPAPTEKSSSTATRKRMRTPRKPKLQPSIPTGPKQARPASSKSPTYDPDSLFLKKPRG